MFFRVERFYREHLNQGTEGTAIKILYLITDFNNTGGLTKEEYATAIEKNSDFKPNKLALTFNWGKKENWCEYKVLEKALLEVIDFKKYDTLLTSEERDDVKILIAKTIYKYNIECVKHWNQLEPKLKQLFNESRDEYKKSKKTFFSSEPVNSHLYIFESRIDCFRNQKILIKCITEALVHKYNKIMMQSILDTLKYVPFDLFYEKAKGVKDPIFNIQPLTKLIHGYYETEDTQRLQNIIKNFENNLRAYSRSKESDPIEDLPKQLKFKW